jgi:hypothetical protein
MANLFTIFGVSVFLSVVVKYVLPLGLTGYTKGGLWLGLLTPIILLALGFLWREKQSL